MKKILTFISCILLTIILLGCNQKSYKVGILIYDESDTFMTEYLTEVIKNFDERITYNVSYSNKSQSEQNQQFNNYIDSKYDLLIINAVDRLASSVLIDKAKKENVPLIFINREPTGNLNKESRAYYVGANSIGMGDLQSEMIISSYNQNKIIDLNNDDVIQTVILKGEQGHQDSENRTTRVIEKLTNSGINFEILEISVSNWDRLLAYKESKRLFETYYNIELIISNNDDMALGALDYIKEFNLPITPLFGVDATLSGIEAFNNLEMLGTIVNDYKQQAIIISYIINHELFNKVEEGFDYTKYSYYVNGYIYE